MKLIIEIDKNEKNKDEEYEKPITKLMFSLILGICLFTIAELVCWALK